MKVEVIVEIPKGSRNKYEVDHHTGDVWLDRHLFTAMAYPADYGFVPETLAEDGDPLDVLCLTAEPTYPGVHMYVRPVGVFWMRDEAGPDAKLLCVPTDDPRWDQIQELSDVQPMMLEELKHFFEVYKALEPNKHTEVRDWGGREVAEYLVEQSRNAYQLDHADGHTRRADDGPADATPDHRTTDVEHDTNDATANEA